MLVGSILIGAIAGLVLLNYVQGVEEDVENRVARVDVFVITQDVIAGTCLLYTSPSPRDGLLSRMPSSA